MKIKKIGVPSIRAGRRGYFWRLLLYGLLILLVPVVVMGSIWFIMGKQTEEKQALTQQEHHLELIRLEVEELVSRLDQEIVSLKYGNVYQAYQMEKSPVNTLNITKAIARIKGLDSMILNVYFYDKDRDRIYTTDGQARALEEFQDTGWMEELQQKVSVSHLAVRENVDVLPMENRKDSRAASEHGQTVLSIVSDSSHGGCFVVNLSVKTMAEELYRKYVNDEREFYLADESGEILYGCGMNHENLETGSVMEFHSSPFEDCWWNVGSSLYYAGQIGYEGIYCVEKLQHHLVYGEAERYGAMVLFLALLIMLVTAVMSFVMARRLYEPIGNLYQSIQTGDTSEMTSGDEIAVITRTVKELDLSREGSEAVISRQEELLQAEMLRLLLHQMLSREIFLRETKLPAQEDIRWRFLVCRIHFQGQAQDTEVSRSHIKEVLNTWLSAKNGGIFTEYQYGVYAALYQDTDEDQVRVLYESMRQLTEGVLYYAISEPFTLRSSFVEDFEQCDNEAKNKQFFGEKWTAPVEQTAQFTNLPNYEAVLIRDILLENSSGVETQIGKLSEELSGIGDRENVLEIAQRVYFTVDKECRTKEETDNSRGVLSALQRCETLTEVTDLLRQEFLQLCKNQKNNHSFENEYYTNACAYIQKNYRQNISISDVSDHLGISYAYLSKIFKSKSENGEKLLDYLNRIRIEKAKELLEKTDASLNEIAEQVGYNNAQSLQRFFKKYESVTPGDWRKMSKKK